MATLIELIDRGELLKLDANLGLREMENRRIYALPRFAKWVQKDLPLLGSTWNIELQPDEQLDDLTHMFCSGKALPVGHRFKCLTHLGDGIWELKTADLRVFGWFYRKDVFIACDGVDKETVKRHNSYAGYSKQAVRFRDALDLDGMQFISGSNPDDVVSDWYQP